MPQTGALLLLWGVENKEEVEERMKEGAEPWEGKQHPRASACNQALLILL